jgi:hypothetical protein
MSHTLQLPESLYLALLGATRARGVSPTDWIVDQLAASRPELATEERRRAAMDSLRRNVVSLGHATGIDNEGIDADLAREYGNPHKPSVIPGANS